MHYRFALDHTEQTDDCHDSACLTSAVNGEGAEFYQTNNNNEIF